MSQKLPDLVVSPCPIRERLANLYLRGNLLVCCNEWREGVSLHPSWEGAVVVNHWGRYLDFDADPIAGELDESLVCWMGPEDPGDDPLARLRERLPQIPDLGETGSFNAVIEDASLPIDVRTLESGVYFRLCERLDRDFDLRNCSGLNWAPEGMEPRKTYIGDDVVHFAPKRAPRILWPFWRGSDRHAVDQGTRIHCPVERL